MAPRVRQDADLTKVMLHHTQTDATILGADLNKRAVSNAQFGVPYDILINNDGKLDLGPRWIFAVDPKQYLADVSVLQIKRYNVHYLSQASEDSELNRIAIHIALVGDFDGASPSAAQYATLLSLLQYLKKTYPINEVVYHGDTSQTSCPGTLFFSKASLDIADTSPTSFPTPQFELLRPENTFQILPRFTPPPPQQRSTTRSVLVSIAAPTKFHDLPGVVPPPPPPPLEWVFVTNNGINVVDVSNPLLPIDMGVTYVVGSQLGGLQNSADSQYFYHTSNPANSRNVWIFDWATNPLAITRVGAYTDINKWFDSVVLKYGTHTLVVPSEVAAIMLGTLDITDPTTPTLLSTTAGSARQVSLKGGAIKDGVFWGAFVNSGKNGLWSVPLTEPIGPAVFRVNDSTLSGCNVIIGNYLWQRLSTGLAFRIYNINPFSSVAVATYTIHGAATIPSAGGVPLLRGNYLYIPTQDSTSSGSPFEIVDVTNPAAPIFVSQAPVAYSGEATGNGMVLHGNYVYLAENPVISAARTKRFLVYDISNISTPLLVSNILISGQSISTPSQVWGYPNEGIEGLNMIVP